MFRREIASGEIVLDAGRRQQIGVTTAHAELRSLTVPVRAVGRVTYDESSLTDVTLRVGGWIDELYADRLGQPVKQGEPLFTLYSPELFEAQQEYLEAIERQRMARMVGSSDSTEFLAEVAAPAPAPVGPVAGPDQAAWKRAARRSSSSRSWRRPPAT